MASVRDSWRHHLGNRWGRKLCLLTSPLSWLGGLVLARTGGHYDLCDLGGVCLEGVRRRACEGKAISRFDVPLIPPWARGACCESDLLIQHLESLCSLVLSR